MGRGTGKQVGPHCCTYLNSIAVHNSILADIIAPANSTREKILGLHAIIANKLHHLAHIYCCATALLADHITTQGHTSRCTSPGIPASQTHCHARVVYRGCLRRLSANYHTATSTLIHPSQKLDYEH